MTTAPMEGAAAPTPADRQLYHHRQQEVGDTTICTCISSPARRFVGTLDVGVRMVPPAPPSAFQLDPGRRPRGPRLHSPYRVLLALVAVTKGPLHRSLHHHLRPRPPDLVRLLAVRPDGSGWASAQALLLPSSPPPVAPRRRGTRKGLRGTYLFSI